MGVNLVPALDAFGIETFTFPKAADVPADKKSFTAGSVLDGCVTPGPHRILKFDFWTKNVGDTDLVIGNPVDHPSWYEWSPAHGHWHLKDFNEYAIYNANGDQVAPGKKQGFCMVDVKPIPGWPGVKKPKKFDSCTSNQGITVGWADIYGRDLACQFIVIDGLPDGDYTMLATTNAQHVIAEDNYDDNTICTGLRFAGDTVDDKIAPPLHVELATPNVVFNDVPEGETAARAVHFIIRSCRAVSFSITSGPTLLSGTGAFSTLPSSTASLPDGHTVAERDARLWVTYKGTSAGDLATGKMTVKCNETGQTWTLPIVANTIKRPTVAVMLVLDQSGSMKLASGTGAGVKRIDVLHESALRFAEIVQAKNGVGVVSFDDTAHPGVGVSLIGEGDFDVSRGKVKDAINAIKPVGATSIGNGLVLARSTLGPVGGYDKKAMVVFTDGLENTAKWISDVNNLIDDRTFAIGLGTQQQVSTAALKALTNKTGGYLLISGHLTTSTDDYFLLTKYFLQILSAVTNETVVKDPTGMLIPGERVAIPFTLNETDIDSTVIALTDAPGVRFAVRTPNGDVMTPPVAAGLGAHFGVGTNMQYYRFTLPLALGAEPAHAGTWHALLMTDDHRRFLAADAVPEGATAGGGVRYSLNVHAYSNLRMQADCSQNSFEPGATLKIRATLTEYGLPVDHRASVTAALQRPDGTTVTLALPEVEPGVFERTSEAGIEGVYRFRVVAKGWTFRGLTFSREQLVTGAVVYGGDRPSPASDPNVERREKALCALLECLLGEKQLGQFLARHNVDSASLLECVRRYCASTANASRQELMEREGIGEPGSLLQAALAEPDSEELIKRLVMIARQLGL